MSITSEEQTALRVSHDVLNIGGVEILKNGNNHHTIGDSCDVAYTPVDIVTANKCYLIAMLNTQLIEQNVKASHLLGHLKISKGSFAEVVGQNRQGVIFAETLLVNFNQILL